MQPGLQDLAGLRGGKITLSTLPRRTDRDRLSIFKVPEPSDTLHISTYITSCIVL